MARLVTSKPPYFDDFDEKRGYFSVLFKPGVSVQARELNQIQSILGNQVEQLGNHFFKFGSPVKSGSIRLKNHIPYVRLKDLNSQGKPVRGSMFAGVTLKGETSGLLAEILIVTEKDSNDPCTLYVNYKNTAIDGKTSAFLDGETVSLIDDKGYSVDKVTVRCPECEDDTTEDHVSPTGFGCIFSVEPSSYYVNGFIVNTEFQTMVVSKYHTTPSKKLGFDVVQDIVTADSDPTLYDNAIGTPNYSAPGADRYKISLKIASKPLSHEASENFLSLAVVTNGVLSEIKNKPQYADLMDTLARRTYDESGDYTVTPFKVQFKEHLAKQVNDGLLTKDNGGDSSKFVGMLSPGKAYVRGREIERIAETAVVFRKARDTEKRQSNVLRVNHGNYIKVQLDAGSNVFPSVESLSGASDFQTLRVYDAPVSGGNPSGAMIGTIRVKSIELIEGSATGEPVYALYVFDANFSDGQSIGNAKGIFVSGNKGTFAANIVPDAATGKSRIYEVVNNNLLYKLPFEFTSSVRSIDNPLMTDTYFNVMKRMVGSVNSAGIVSFSPAGRESFNAFDHKRWLAGIQNTIGGNFVHFDLTADGVISATPTDITVNVGVQYAGLQFSLVASVLTANALEKTKILKTKKLNQIAADVDEISLMVCDAHRIVSVTDITSDNPDAHTDITDQYVLIKNINDNYYGVSSIRRADGKSATVGTKINVEVEYFDHVGDGLFFSVDSYTALINDPNIDFGYEDIPVYKSKDGGEYRLSDTLDFRLRCDATGKLIAPSSLIADESNLMFDVHYYLPRIDTLCVTEHGEFKVVEGIPSLNPVPPSPAENSMPIYSVIMNAYTFDVKRDVKPSYIDNRRYTMRDIGKLDKRIENLEYYVTFNMLEKETSEMSILDSNGDTRFKNGFLVDNFKDYSASDTKSPEYNCALDTEKGILRPSFAAKNVPLEIDAKSNHFIQVSDMITLPYSSVVYQDQPFSSKTVSVNPYFIFEVEGSMQLSPNSDVWSDTTTEPDLVVDIDTGVDALRDVANAAGILGTQWGSWRTNDSSTNVVSQQTSTNWLTRSVGWFARRAEVTTTTTTTATTQDQSRSGRNRRVSESISRRSLGENVTSVNLLPHLRSIDVQFAASNMRPNTKVYAFFDGVDVTEDCRLLNGVRGGDLVTDGNGSIVGVFRIPNHDGKRFFVGTRIFRLTNSATNSLDVDELTTSAECQFYGGGLAQTRRETVLSVRSPEVIENEVRQARTVTTVQTNTTTQTNSTPWFRWRRFGDDPLAQSFKVSEKNGVFVTGIDIFFVSKSEDIPVWLELRNMNNGMPSSVKIPYGRTTLLPENVKISDDGSVPTRFEFEAPVYLQSDEEYCFVVGSSSEAYHIHVSKLGGKDKLSGATISSQPHIGSMFKSQNDSTWTAEQYEDIKFKMYRADFDTTKRMNLEFTNTPYVNRASLDFNPFETEEGSNRVRVYHKNHGLVKNDKVKFDLLSDTWITLHVNSGHLVVGQTLRGATNGGTAIVRDLQYVGRLDDSSASVYRVKLSSVVGDWASGESFIGDLYVEQFRNPHMLKTLGIVPSNLSGVIPTGVMPLGITEDYNGIPFGDFSKSEHLVVHVDHIDSYVIEVNASAVRSGRVGGAGNYGYGAAHIDALNLRCSLIDFLGDSRWRMSGVSHSGVGSVLTDYTSIPEFDVELNEDTELAKPMKIASFINEKVFLGDNKSLTLKLECGSDDSFISPVINIDTLTLTAIENRVDMNTCENFSVSPNAGEWTNHCSEPGSTARFITLNSGEGIESAKYIMKPVYLRNPATDIKVFMDVERHIGSSVDVYYRVVSADSEQDISTSEWVKIDNTDDVVSEYSGDFKEKSYNAAGDNDDIEDFKVFQVKLVMSSSNSAKPPKIRNFRAIAVT